MRILILLVISRAVFFRPFGSASYVAFATRPCFSQSFVALCFISTIVIIMMLFLAFILFCSSWASSPLSEQTIKKSSLLFGLFLRFYPQSSWILRFDNYFRLFLTCVFCWLLCPELWSNLLTCDLVTAIWTGVKGFWMCESSWGLCSSQDVKIKKVFFFPPSSSSSSSSKSNSNLVQEKYSKVSRTLPHRWL